MYSKLENKKWYKTTIPAIYMLIFDCTTTFLIVVPSSLIFISIKNFKFYILFKNELSKIIFKCLQKKRNERINYELEYAGYNN